MGKIYTIKKLLIEIPEIEDIKRYMKQTCDSHIALGVYNNNEPLLII